jgi:hypothetical protein
MLCIQIGGFSNEYNLLKGFKPAAKTPPYYTLITPLLPPYYTLITLLLPPYYTLITPLLLPYYTLITPSQ